MNVAILGANGFVGYRLFEAWQTHGAHRPRAVVRQPSSLARIARFGGADWKLADARHAPELTQAFAGCEAVVHCVVGDERVIAATIEPVYLAAAAAGVRDLVYLSTASVHGLAPAAGTDENTPLRDDQSIAYNNAKVRAERRIRALAADGRVRVTILRPGIVLGPRSYWEASVIEALLSSRAWWLGGGAGVCQSIHVDNLIHAIEQVLATPSGAGGTYLVGDAERVTWRDLYLGLAATLGLDENAFAEALPADLEATASWRDRLVSLKSGAPVQAVLPYFPSRLKDTFKAGLARWSAPAPSNPWALPAGADRPRANAQMTQLFSCATKLSHARAADAIGYRPPVSFLEGLRRTTAWFAAAGYPLKPAASANPSSEAR